MSVFKSWKTVNLMALATGIAVAALIGTGTKIDGDGLIQALPTKFAQGALFAGLAWLLLAIFRFVLLQREVNR